MATCSVSSVSRGNVIFEILNITGNNIIYMGVGGRNTKGTSLTKHLGVRIYKLTGPYKEN